MRRIVIILAVLACALSMAASENVPDFRFRADGTFKIMQATDLHLCFTPHQTDVSKLAIANLCKALHTERPDVLIITGDAVFASPDSPAWDALLEALSNTGVPFVWLNGNHDTENTLTLAEITAKVNSAKGSIVKLNERGEITDMSITIKDSKDKPKAILYLFDSHSNSKVPGVGGYDWLYPSQIAWYRKEASAHRAANGGSPLPALAFMHIPTAEWTQAYNQTGAVNSVGIRLERECPAQVHSGLISAVHEQGDIMGLFAGHDHDNDYICKYMGLAFGYGRFSGAPNVYLDILQGYRIINLVEGQRDFTSYIRLLDGRIIDQYRFSDAPKTAEQRENEAAAAAGINYAQWMKAIPDSKQLNRVSIPATHDSGSTQPSHDLQCQVIGIADQLLAGIRGFDMRLKADLDGTLGVYHAEKYQEISWENDVLPAMTQFLEANPSEALVVSVKCEGNSREEYAKRLAKSMTDKRFAKYFVQGFNPNITMGEARGKIVFVIRTAPAMNNYPGALCSGWDDNVTCPVTLTGSNGVKTTALVEDIYFHEDKWDSPSKVKEIMKNVNAARAAKATSPEWFITFVSATSAPNESPRDLADIVNPGVAHELQQMKGACGVLLLDFAGTPAARAITRSLIQSNF